MLVEELRERLGADVRRFESLHGGCIGEVYQAELADGRQIVVKRAQRSAAQLDVEGYMLRYLAANSALPVPEVFLAEPELLVMSYISGNSRFDRRAQEHAAELLAALHEISADRFGLECDTLIGGLHQPNRWTASWLAFFAEQRLVYMAREAEQRGRLSATLGQRVERLAGVLDRWLQEPPRPSLIHGDVWTTNVLAQGGKVTGFLDPAIYYADAEIELAFVILFGTFGEHFFRRYQELRPIPASFFEERRDLYNLYPLLVHVRLFGGSYVGSVEQILRQFGF